MTYRGRGNQPPNQSEYMSLSSCFNTATIYDCISRVITSQQLVYCVWMLQILLLFPHLIASPIRGKDENTQLHVSHSHPRNE